LLKKRIGAVKYLIVGSPFPGNENHLERLHKLIDELGVRDQVLFTGDIENMKTVYKVLDVLVVPSCTPEPLAGVVLEAMALGTPVIGTSIGGTVEQIQDGVSGILIEPNNPELLAEKIYQLLTEQKLLDALRSGARKRVEEVFRFEKMYERLEQIYTEVLNS
jgi:glycosyltransferase involved in cell wall biosynthesis